jgi:PelA/Pel-15E family pectate lyase
MAVVANKKEMSFGLRLYKTLSVAGLLLATSAFSQDNIADHDAVADHMLLYQRSVGGWPKHIGEEKIDYTKPISEAAKAGLLDDKFRNDATIDNNATSKEIRYLIKAYKTSGNKNYLQAAENGVRYLLQMQKPNGGFPQFYPDSSLYRGQITYNDNAMINALNVLWDVAYGKAGFDAADARLKAPAKAAIEKGIECILNTQVKVAGKPTVWCAQHDKATLVPVKARAFELASLSGSESIGIVEFLMKVENPSPQVKNAVNSAVQWLDAAKIKGYKTQRIEDKSQPKGEDVVLVKDDASTIWARFYDLETGKPFFCGRDGVKKASLSEIEYERRTGYAWYGTWPQRLLEKEYPEWKKKNS